MATTDLHTTFLRAVVRADVVADARIERLGRTLAFARVVMRARPLDASSEVDPEAAVATAVGTFALLSERPATSAGTDADSRG